MKKVLIVDDDEQIRNFLNDVLRMNGYEVDCASNGEEALKLLEHKNYDLLITDNKMPKMSGLELVRIIKNKKLNIKIIAISGEEVEKSFTELGISEFFRKPIRYKKLLKSLERLVQYE
jgi:DNA-binding NtrC family response regulator